MTADIQSGRGIKNIKSRISHLESTWVHAYWYESVASGSSGTITPPSGGTLELDRFASGVDALASTITGGEIDWKSPVTAGGIVVAATLDGSGNYTLTGTPSAYPVAVIFAYKIKLLNFDLDYSIGEVEIEPAHNSLIGLVPSTSGDGTYPHFYSTAHYNEYTNWIDHVTLGADGSISMPDATTAAKGITLGGDVQLYRSAADTLYTPDNLIAIGDVGIGGAPDVRLHINDRAFTAWRGSFFTFAFTVNDAIIDLVSSSAGSWGSALNFKECDHVTGAYEGGWSFYKQTKNGDGSLRVTYGTSANTYNNAATMIFDTDGGLQLPLITASGQPLLIGGDWAIYRGEANVGYLGSGDSLLFPDNSLAYFGTGKDATISYDATNLIINPKAVGSGYANVAGALVVDDYVRIASSALEDTPIAGAIEYYNDRMYITNVGTQRAIDRTSDVATATVTVENTTTETLIYTGDVPAGSAKASNVVKINAAGTVIEASASDAATVRIKLGASTIATVVSPGTALTTKCWDITAKAVVRSVGASGVIAWYVRMSIAGAVTDSCGVSTVDTTTAADVTITAQWNNAKAGNIFTLVQGFMEYKN